MRAQVRLLAVSLAAALAYATLSGCSGGPVEYAGNVVDDSVTLQVPALPMPAVDPDAGFAASQSAEGTGARRSQVATALAITGLGSVARVQSVSVQAGDPVRAGQEVARLDSAVADANVAVALATLATAKSQVAVVDEALDTVGSARVTLAERRAQVVAAESRLVATRRQLAAQLAQAKALLARVEAMGGGGQPGVPPGGVIPTGTPPPGGPLPDPAQLQGAVAKLTAALGQIDAGLATVASGRARISSAGAKLSDARTQLTSVRSLARVAADAAAVGVRLARYQRELVVLRSPSDGVVVSAVSAGEVLAPGATVAKIRRDGAPRVTTWLAPEALGDIEVGAAAEVSADWFASGPGLRGEAPIRGTVTRVDDRAQYPPTSFATSEVHLTRAVRIEITLPESAEQPALPPGAPVDVRFLGK